tara:strand:+ start:429 stop:938 length:510 start_codon:yes stop_codon:yes gene_type:complete
MELDVKDKIQTKDRIINFLNNNKLKIIIFVSSLLILLIIVIILEINKQKKNDLIAESYIQARLLLNSGKKEDSLVHYKKIIESKHKFYSILALNTIIEKNLIQDHTKIIEYFDLVEKKLNDDEQGDLLKFKKALYLIKKNKNQESKKLLEELIDKNSNLKELSEEVLKK